MSRLNHIDPSFHTLSCQVSPRPPVPSTSRSQRGISSQLLKKGWVYTNVLLARCMIVFNCWRNGEFKEMYCLLDVWLFSLRSDAGSRVSGFWTLTGLARTPPTSNRKVSSLFTSNSTLHSGTTRLSWSTSTTPRSPATPRSTGCALRCRSTGSCVDWLPLARAPVALERDTSSTRPRAEAGAPTGWRGTAWSWGGSDRLRLFCWRFLSCAECCAGAGNIFPNQIAVLLSFYYAYYGRQNQGGIRMLDEKHIHMRLHARPMPVSQCQCRTGLLLRPDLNRCSGDDAIIIIIIIYDAENEMGWTIHPGGGGV